MRKEILRYSMPEREYIIGESEIGSLIVLPFITIGETMTLNEFQEQCEKNSVYKEKIKTKTLELMYLALGLNGEAGEVAEEFKKFLRNDFGIMTIDRRENIKLELGDCLWYIAMMAKVMGFSLQEIAESNIKKLDRRKRMDRQ